MDALREKKDINDCKKCKQIKIENDRFLTQNSKLIKNLEEISLEFSKSQTKLKEMGLRDDNKLNFNGNLIKLMDQIKSLESDNRKLCEELYNEINMRKMQGSIVKEDDMEIYKSHVDSKPRKSGSEEKAANLKIHIQELQKQLIKTQKIAFENEYNYKVRQIETLEALKSCEIDKNSFVNKISDLEEKAKDMIRLHEENFALKTAVNDHLSELQSTKEHCEKLNAKATKSMICMKELEEKRQSTESALAVSQQKVDELTMENQCLLSTLEELSGSTTQVSNRPADENKDACDACAKLSGLLITAREDLRIVEMKLKEYDNEKVELNKNDHEKSKMLEQFEEEQKKLRTELGNLFANNTNFDSVTKSKDNEIDSLRCQLASVQQRLELRDQRVIEVSNQLSKALSEEKNKSTKNNRLIEKLKSVEKTLSSSQLEHSNSTKENSILTEKIARYQVTSSENDKVIEELRSQIRQSETQKDQMKQSLESSTSALESKTHEFSSKTASLCKKVDELSYSIKIYEKENQNLEKSLKQADDEIGVLRTSVQREEQTHRIEIDRAQLQLQKDVEISDQQLAEIRSGCLQIEALRKDLCDLEGSMRDKDMQIESTNVRNALLDKQLIDCRAELDETTKQLKHLHQEFLEYQQLKIDFSDVTKEKKKMKHILMELNLKYDIVNRNMLAEKDRVLNEESKYRELAAQFETMQFKFSYVEEELSRAKIYTQQLEEKERTELKTHIDKMNTTMSERDDALVRIRIIEVSMDRYEKESREFQHQIEDLKKVVNTQKDELHRRGQCIQVLEKQECTLQEHIKCGQLTIVERSREIDRLEQLVRDRSEEIELRSGQLQAFQCDLETKLLDMETKVQKYRENEEKHSTEYAQIKKYSDKLLDKLKCQEQLLEDALKVKKEKEDEMSSVMKQNEDLKIENQSLDRCVQSSKDEIVSKTLLVKEMYQQIHRKDKELEKSSEIMESKMCDMAAKERQIGHLEDQMKKNRNSFTETETKLKAELKLTTRRLECFDDDARKYCDRVEKKHKLECNKIVEELSLKVAEVEKLSKEVDIISAKLQHSEEEMANIGMDLETHKSVLIDTENNCRLKGVVIGRLLKKLNMDSLRMYAEQLNASIEDHNANEVDGDSRYVDVYEGVSLQELIARINKTLECE